MSGAKNGIARIVRWHSMPWFNHARPSKSPRRRLLEECGPSPAGAQHGRPITARGYLTAPRIPSALSCRAVFLGFPAFAGQEHGAGNRPLAAGVIGDLTP